MYFEASAEQPLESRCFGDLDAEDNLSVQVSTTNRLGVIFALPRLLRRELHGEAAGLHNSLCYITSSALLSARTSVGQFIALCIITMSAYEYTLSRALPRHVSEEYAISLLHRHENIISLGPHVIRRHALTSPADTTQLYNIVDKIDHLPFGLYSGKVPIKAEFTNKANGVTSVRDAPFGLTLREVWSVQPLNTITETGYARNELVLNVKMSGSSAILALFENMIKKSHERISV